MVRFSILFTESSCLHTERILSHSYIHTKISNQRKFSKQCFSEYLYNFEMLKEFTELTKK